MKTLKLNPTLKKILAIALIIGLIAVMIFALSACNNGKSDWEYIADKGVLKIGITVFNPMNYYEDDGKTLTGFDTEFALAVCEKLGVRAEFKVIQWENKITELKSKNVDCIWNGMTITEDLATNMDFSSPYMKNKQVCVIRKADSAIYTNLASMVNAKTGAESTSAGEKAVAATEYLKDSNYTTIESQASVLLELKSLTIDVGIIDYVMAVASVGEGTDYSELMIVPNIELAVDEQAVEKYGIGLRKNSPNTVAKINQAIKELYDDGTLTALETKYGLTGSLIPQL